MVVGCFSLATPAVAMNHNAVAAAVAVGTWHLMVGRALHFAPFSFQVNNSKWTTLSSRSEQFTFFVKQNNIYILLSIRFSSFFFSVSIISSPFVISKEMFFHNYCDLSLCVYKVLNATKIESFPAIPYQCMTKMCFTSERNWKIYSSGYTIVVK